MKSEQTAEHAALSPDNKPVIPELPEGFDRRAFLMRSALFGATAVITGCAAPTEQQVAATPPPAAPPAAAAPPLSEDLNVVKKAKGPVMTTLEEFYKVGPGPSSSHTIGPMRITYDFYQRCIKLPADQLAIRFPQSAAGDAVAASFGRGEKVVFKLPMSVISRRCGSSGASRVS